MVGQLCPPNAQSDDQCYPDALVGGGQGQFPPYSTGVAMAVDYFRAGYGPFTPGSAASSG